VIGDVVYKLYILGIPQAYNPVDSSLKALRCRAKRERQIRFCLSRDGSNVCPLTQPSPALGREGVD
jgi:hypothetical protein